MFLSKFANYNGIFLHRYLGDTIDVLIEACLSILLQIKTYILKSIYEN